MMIFLAGTFFLLSLVKCSFSRAHIDYVCPIKCQCALLPNRLDAVQLVCFPPIIREDIFDIASIPANYTTWLTISCKVDLLISHLTNETFSHLKHLEELLITNCVSSNHSQECVLGIKAPKTLECH